MFSSVGPGYESGSSILNYLFICKFGWNRVFQYSNLDVINAFSVKIFHIDIFFKSGDGIQVWRIEFSSVNTDGSSRFDLKMHFCVGLFRGAADGSDDLVLCCGVGAAVILPSTLRTASLWKPSLRPVLFSVIMWWATLDNLNHFVCAQAAHKCACEDHTQPFDPEIVASFAHFYCVESVAILNIFFVQMNYASLVFLCSVSLLDLFVKISLRADLSQNDKAADIFWTRRLHCKM